MPYIPPQNRPAIDQRAEALADRIALRLEKENLTAAISEVYRDSFMKIARGIAALEKGAAPPQPADEEQALAQTIVAAAKAYQQQGGFLGELNYALTRLIQLVPYRMHQRGVWKEALRYWLYAETVGALVRTSYELHAAFGNDWISNGMAGVFEDVKDEYKRRVNTAYEALQILKSGDCYEKAPFHTQLVEFETGGAKGWIEVMLPKQELK
jgi:hypothetical protein